MKEFWIDFDDYQVSNTGKVRNKHKKIMSTSSGFVMLSGKMYRVKNLVANLFLGVEPGKKVKLIDPDKGYGVENIDA